MAPYFVDWTSYRSDFEREASRILGRDVSVEGSASARLLPFPSVTFTDVVVAGVEGGSPAMTVETFSMDAELAPFMRGDVHIFDMRLVRPSVTIDVAADGSLDWAARPSVPIGARHISLEKLTVTEGSVSVRHAASGRVHRLTEINADISARALTGPWRMEGSLRLDGMVTAMSVSTGPVDAEGGMRLRIQASPQRYPLSIDADGSARIAEGGVDYSGLFKLTADPRGGKEAADTGKAEAPPAYRMSGTFDFNHRELAVDAFRFETGPLQDPYTAEGSARFALGAEPRFEITADGSQVRLDEATAEVTGGASLQTRLAALREFLLDMPRPAIDGRVEVKLPAVVAGDTTVRDVQLVASPTEGGWDIASLAATLPGRSSLEAQGKLAVGDALDFEGSLLLAVAQPSGFAAWLSKDVDEAIRRLPAAGFSAQVQLGEQQQVFRDLELVLGTARFRGEIDSRTPSEARPSMTLRLDGDRLDVEDMAAFASLFVGESGATRLADRDLEFEIVAGPVSAAGLTAETLDTALRLKNGTLEIDRLSITGMSDANVSATGTVRDVGVDPTGNIDLTMISSDLSPLAETLRQRFPDSALTRAVVGRASLYPELLRDASIQVVASVAANGNGTKGLAASANGALGGGTSFTLAATSADVRQSLAEAEVDVRFSARSDAAAALYAIYGLPSLPLGVAGGGETELRFDGKVREGGQTRFSFAGEGLDLGFEGEAALVDGALSANGKTTLVSEDFAPWLMTAGIGLPGMELGLPVDIAASLDVGDGVLVLSGLNGDVAGSSLRGDINAQMKNDVPHLTGALSLSALDLYPVAEMAVGAAALTPEADGWPRTAFASNVATPATAELDIAAEQLGLGAFGTIEDARLGLRIGKQGISVSGLDGDFHGGRASGLVDFRNDGGTGLLSAQLRLRDGDIVSMLGETGLSGSADLTATVTASGKSIDGIVAALAGSGTAVVRDIVIDGVAPGALPALLAEAETFGPEIDATATASFAPELVRRGRFAADGAEIAFTIANGTVRAPPVRLEADGASMTVEARANLSNATIGADATLTYDAGADALVGSEPTVRLTAGGPLDDIGVLADTAPLAQFLTQRALEREQRRVEAMQASLLESQRHRREVRYYASLAEERENEAAAARRAAEEAERLQRELRQQQEGMRRAEEQAERRRQEEEAERRRIEEQTRLDAQEQDRRRAAEQAAREEAETRRLEDERFRAQVEEMLRSRDGPAPQDSILRTPLPPAAVDGVAPTPRPAPRQDPAAAEPGTPSKAFSEENLTLDGLMRVLRGNR